MAHRCHCGSTPFLSFLYPSFASPRLAPAGGIRRAATVLAANRFYSSTVNDLPESRLNPSPDDYSAPNFADKAEITLYAGRGGSGCVSFQREAYMPDGPPNGGDGGSGGSIYIQAAHSETSLHKLARRRFVRAGRGKTGQGSARNGTRGEDVVLTVPVGTVVRELYREDPVAEEAMNVKAYRSLQKQRKKEENIRENERRRQAKLDAIREELREQEEEDDPEAEAEAIEGEMETEEYEDVYRRRHMKEEEEGQDEDAELAQNEDDIDDPGSDDPLRHKWILYPGLSKTDVQVNGFPRMPSRGRLLHQPPAPIYLDLSSPSKQPILLASGGIGGLGNPHFTSRQHPRPMFATRGDEAVTMRVELELKLLADVGLVGLPNAGKSTLVRAMTNSRARVGSWAFTTLQPNIGTVVLDKYSGRPLTSTRAGEAAERRTRFTIADIPGLIEGAHLDRGLGIAFLRHVERAGVLAFVIDLANGDAVAALKSLWTEVGLYAQMRAEEEHDRQAESRVDWDLTSDTSSQGPINVEAYMASLEGGPDESPAVRIAGKPWFVVATKADLPGTQDNYRELKQYVGEVSDGRRPHPSGVEGAWTKNVTAIPVSAINNQGVDRITNWTVGLLEAD